MTGLDEFSFATRALVVLLALLTLEDFLRHRGAVRLDTNLMFGSLANLVVAQEVTSITGFYHPWLVTLGLLSALCQPFLLLRLVRHFRGVPAPIYWTAGIGLLLAAMLVFAGVDTAYPALLAIIVVAYFEAVEGYAAIALARGAVRTGGVTRWRMGLAAAGSVLLALLVLLTVSVAALPEGSKALSVLALILGPVVGVTYYLGFIPPGWVRRIWQHEEVHAFLQQAIRRPPDAPPEAIVHSLCRAAVRIAGGAGAVAAHWEPEDQVLKVVAHEPPGVLEPGSVIPITGRVAGQAWREGKGIAHTGLAGLGTLGRQWAAALHADGILVVPITTNRRRWGLLIVYLARPSLFPHEDLELIGMLATECAETLEHGELVARQRVLLNRLAISRRELEAADSAKQDFLTRMSDELRPPLSAITDCADLLLDQDWQGVSEVTRRAYVTHIHQSATTLLTLVNRVTDSPGGGLQPADDEASVYQDASPVLLVEEDLKAASLLEIYLSLGGYAVAVAADGEEALRKARQSRPLAVILDLLLPRPGGWETLRALRKDPQTQDVSVLVVSVAGSNDVGMAIGAVDYFVEPADRDALSRRLGQVMEARKTPQEPVRVLAVGAEPAALEFLTAAAGPAGIMLLRASTAEEAVVQARWQPSDLVLLGRATPAHGFQALARLKTDPATRDLPVLIITGEELSEAEKEQLNGCVLSVLRKGASDRDQLLRLVEQVRAKRP